MTWSYSGDPSASSLDEVRFLVGDTDSTEQLVQNEEIAYAINAEITIGLAAVRVLRALAGKYARKADKAVGDLRISYSQLQKSFMDLADKLEENELSPVVGTVLKPSPYAGGISVSDKESVEDNTDRTEPSFKRGMNDNPPDWPEEDDDYCRRR